MASNFVGCDYMDLAIFTCSVLAAMIRDSPVGICSWSVMLPIYILPSKQSLTALVLSSGVLWIA